MEAKIVSKKVYFLLIVIFSSVNIIAQSTSSKHILFNSLKDSVITIENIKYYKIDKNLFDINRYSQIDTINKKVYDLLKFISVRKLVKESNKIFHKISEKKNLLIETRNEIFEKIYVIEKLPNSKYKRTRVWWVDY